MGHEHLLYIFILFYFMLEKRGRPVGSKRKAETDSSDHEEDIDKNGTCNCNIMIKNMSFKSLLL